MGINNSERRYRSSIKLSTENFGRLSAKILRKNTLIALNQWNICIVKGCIYKIYLTTTRPNYGGIRWWFLCPQGCGKRVGVLYFANEFSCRHCLNLSYSTQNENYAFRMLRKAQKIHQELGGNWAEDYAPPPKPKGMHWRTYQQKLDALEKADFASMKAAGWL